MDDIFFENRPLDYNKIETKEKNKKNFKFCFQKHDNHDLNNISKDIKLKNEDSKNNFELNKKELNNKLENRYNEKVKILFSNLFSFHICKKKT